MFEHGRRGTSNILYLWPMLALVGRSSTLKFQNQFSNWNLSSGWKGNWSEGLVKRQTTSSIPTLLELCLLIIFQHKYAARLGCMERGMKTLKIECKNGHSLSIIQNELVETLFQSVLWFPIMIQSVHFCLLLDNHLLLSLPLLASTYQFFVINF